MVKQKIYELTTNAEDGYRKWYVRGINTDEEARTIARKGFGKYYSDRLISYYDDYPSARGTNWKKQSYTISGFLKVARKIYL